MSKQVKITSFFSGSKRPQSTPLKHNPANEEGDDKEKEEEEEDAENKAVEKTPDDSASPASNKLVKKSPDVREPEIVTLDIDTDANDDSGDGSRSPNAVSGQVKSVGKRERPLDDDEDSDEVQKPRDKSKIDHSIWSHTPVKLKTTPKRDDREQPKSYNRIEDGIIGMKVRSPPNGRES